MLVAGCLVAILPCKVTVISLTRAEHRLIPARAVTVLNRLLRGGHAGVGVVYMRGASLSLLCFWCGGRGGGGGPFICASQNQGGEGNPEKFRLCDLLVDEVVREARVACGHLVVIMHGGSQSEPGACLLFGPGDLCLALGYFEGCFLPLVVGSLLFVGMSIVVLVLFVVLMCPHVLAAASGSGVLLDRWFPPHVAVRAGFLRLLVGGLWFRLPQPLWPASWKSVVDRS